jgi:hypothetical protein
MNRIRFRGRHIALSACRFRLPQQTRTNKLYHSAEDESEMGGVCCFGLGGIVTALWLYRRGVPGCAALWLGMILAFLPLGLMSLGMLFTGP